MLRNATNYQFYTSTIKYELGYPFTLKAKKVWISDPPLDVSSIKYVYLEQLSKKKTITEDSEENLELIVASKTVKFTPKFPNEYEETGSSPNIYRALHAKMTGTDNWMALIEIEGFYYEERSKYILTVRKINRAEPYLIRFILIDINSRILNNSKTYA